MTTTPDRTTSDRTTSDRTTPRPAATPPVSAALPVPPARPPRRPRVAPPAQLEAAPKPRPYRTLLRYGVTPFLLLLDLAAWAAAAQIAGWGLPSLALLLVSLMLYAGAGLYRSRLTLSILDDGSRLVGRSVAAAAAVVAGEVVLGRSTTDDRVLPTAGLLAVGILLLRALGYAVVRRARAHGLVGHPTLVLGAGKVGAQIAALLLDHPEYGLRPVGFLDRDPLVGPEGRPVPLLGGDEVLAETIVEFRVRDVIVAFGSLPESGLVEVLRTCDRLDCEIFFVPRLFELHNTSRDMDHVWGLPLVRLRRAAFRSWSWKVKRGMDVLASAAAVLALAPVFGLVALGVRLEGGPGIIFRQTRVGLDNRPFQVLKFRSLRPVDEAESATQWNIAQDGRLGPVGRFLRATSLDELPQLWNILRGDMSIVGPRPERPHFVETFASTLPYYTARHRVPAGLTGWAQVHGLRGDTSIEERARFDNYYIENWSLWLDVRIILMTVASVLRRAGG